MKPTAALLPLALLLACSDDGGRATASASASGAATTLTTAAPTSSDGSGDPTDGAVGSTSSAGTSTGDATSSASGNSGNSGSGPKFDLGDNGTGGTTGGQKGCQKVDFLFVIDNSASMEDNQDALIASFPGFIDAIKTTLSATDDYHIMVVDTDDDGRCSQPCVMDADYAQFCLEANLYACKANLSACDTTRGAGVVQPVGLYASNKVCPITGGHRYMLPEEPDLQTTFACVAKVGTAGNPSERPMNGMTEALSDALNGPGGCNEGFLRDDAILVVTFISDDPNYEDMGAPQEWYDAVVAAKNGNIEAIVVAGLIPQPDQGCSGGGNIGGAHWKEFIAKWGDHGIEGSVCEPDYAPFFQQAVGVIDEACDNFIPG